MGGSNETQRLLVVGGAAMGGPARCPCDARQVRQPRNIRCESWLEADGKELGHAFVVARSGQRAELEWTRGRRSLLLFRPEAV